MDSSASFKPNGPNVVHETIDGETVVINLDTGNYYSLQRTGAEIWDLIVRGATIEQIHQYLGGRYKGASESIEQGVADLISELQKQELIVPFRRKRRPLRFPLKNRSRPEKNRRT